MKLRLRFDNRELTGVLNPAPTNEVAITDGRLEGNRVTFSVIRSPKSGIVTSHFDGRITGDSIEGAVRVERNGDTNNDPWNALRNQTVAGNDSMVEAGVDQKDSQEPSSPPATNKIKIREKRGRPATHAADSPDVHFLWASFVRKDLCAGNFCRIIE